MYLGLELRSKLAQMDSHAHGIVNTQHREQEQHGCKNITSQVLICSKVLQTCMWILCYPSQTLILPLHIQYSVVMRQSNKLRSCIHQCRYSDRISIRCWIHKRYPILHPNRWAIVCLCEYFFYKIDCAITAPHCICSNPSEWCSSRWQVMHYHDLITHIHYHREVIHCYVTSKVTLDWYIIILAHILKWNEYCIVGNALNVKI